MLTLNQRRKFFIKLEDVYFCEAFHQYQSKCDVVFFDGAMGTVPPGGYGSVSDSIIVDLSPSEDVLFEHIRKSNRREIRKALDNENIAIQVIDHPDKKDIDRFVDQFHLFTLQKGMNDDDCKMLYDLLDHCVMNIIYAIEVGSDRVFSGVVDIIDPRISNGLHAFCHFRACDTDEERRLSARANKLLYWTSIINAKQKGSSKFNLGQAPADLESIAGINHFKLGFGGESVATSTFYYGYTFLGKMIVHIFRLMKKNTNMWEIPKSDS